jgi:hypothetical protein
VASTGFEYCPEDLFLKNLKVEIAGMKNPNDVNYKIHPAFFFVR